MKFSRVFDYEEMLEDFDCIGWKGAFCIGRYDVDDLAF